MSDCNHLSSSLISDPCTEWSYVLCLQRFNQLILVISSLLLMYINAHVPVTAHFMYVITKEKNEVSQSLNSARQEV